MDCCLACGLRIIRAPRAWSSSHILGLGFRGIEFASLLGVEGFEADRSIGLRHRWLTQWRRKIRVYDAA